MSCAYYNENDPKAAAWLRELITGRHIAYGYVDERSILDVAPSDLDGFTQCHFFAGIGGWSYALRLAGIGDDEKIWTGSCPCQPFSTAGKGGGFADERHLWPAWFHLVRACKPAVVFGEQVGAALEWFDLVRADMEREDYALGCAIIGAHSVGKPHVRQRLFWVAKNANANKMRQQRQRGVASAPIPELERLVQDSLSGQTPTGDYSLRDDGLPFYMAALSGFGNAVIPQAAAAFIETYLEATS